MSFLTASWSRFTKHLRPRREQVFEVRDVENLREHYEKTLRLGVRGLERNAELALQHVSETTYRIGACTWLVRPRRFDAEISPSIKRC